MKKKKNVQVARVVVTKKTKKKRKKKMNKRGRVLEEAMEIINGERQDQYGDPEDSFDLIAEYWTVFLRNKLLQKADGRSMDDIIFHEFLNRENVVMMMALFKLSREHHQGKRDNIRDAVGYLGIYDDIREDDIPEVCKEEEILEKLKSGTQGICSFCNGTGEVEDFRGTTLNCMICEGVGYA